MFSFNFFPTWPLWFVPLRLRIPVSHLLVLTRRGNVRHLSLLKSSVLFFDVCICVFIIGLCNDASIDQCRYSLVICIYVCRRFPEIVKSKFKFHVCGSVLSSVRDLSLTRMGMVEITYTQLFVEKMTCKTECRWQNISNKSVS